MRQRRVRCEWCGLLGPCAPRDLSALKHWNESQGIVNKILLRADETDRIVTTDKLVEQWIRGEMELRGYEVEE
jgi:hypothetical protein